MKFNVGQQQFIFLTRASNWAARGNFIWFAPTSPPYYHDPCGIIGVGYKSKGCGFVYVRSLKFYLGVLSQGYL